MELQPYLSTPYDLGEILPPQNLYGQFGPLCEVCSGLGRVIRPSFTGSPTRSTSRCTCKGTGVDLESVRQAEMSSLLKRITSLEETIRNANLPPNLTSRTKRPSGKMSRQTWEELIAWATASGTAVANTTTETILFPNVTIPANYMSDGRCVFLRLKGQYSTLGSGTVTLIFTVRWNGVAGTVICKTGTVTVLISLTNCLWEVEVELQTRSNGSAGSIMGNGVARVYGGTAPTIGSATGAPAVAPVTNGGQTTPAAATLDLTADTPLSVTVTHGAASASNTAQGLQYTLASRN